MKRSCGIFLVVIFLGIFSFGQTKNPVTSVVREILPRQHKNIVAAVETMPADKFSYKPTPEQMTFAHLVLHIIDSNNYLCAKASDTPAPKTEELKESDSKEKLVAALKAIENRLGVVAVSIVEQHLEVTVEDTFPDQELLGELVRADIGVRSFAPITSDLSEAFLRLTEPRVEEEEADESDIPSGPPPPLRGDSPREGGSAYPSPPRGGRRK